MISNNRLSLDWNGIGEMEQGIIAIAESLKENSHLTSLDLRSNRINAQGGVALAYALRSNRSLIKLGLEGSS